MSPLQRQTLTIIETCRQMLRIPNRFRPDIDAATSAAANEILVRIREAKPHDDTLRSLKVEEATFSWWTLLYMMESVNRVLS